MSYQAEEMELRAFFNENIQYTIPRYQRNYVWTEKEWKILIEDIIYAANEQKNHFLGSFIIKKLNSSQDNYKRDLIDGQQRLITLNVILFSFIYLLKVYKEKFSNSHIDDRIEVLRNFISFKDERTVKQVLKFDLQNDEYLKLSELSLENNNIEMYKEFFNKKNNISIVFAYFVDEFKKLFFEKEDNLKKFIDFQVTLLNIKIIPIIADNYLEANTLFEIVNARGVPLKTMELLKNYLFRFSDGYKVLDIENNNWNEMLADFLDSKIDCDIYLHHFMEMYYGYEGTKEKMYSYIKEKEKKTLDNSKMSLFDSILGCYLHYINISKDKKNRLHEYLNIKNIKSWFSLVLSLEIQYDRKIISQKEYENYLKMILCFLIVFNLNKSTTNKIAKYITRCSNNIYLAKDFSEIEKEFYSFMKKISDYYPSDKKVKELIDGIRYSNKNKSASNINSSLLIFLLKPLYLELINNEGCFEINFDKMNIEHIIPDNDLNENTWRIGNLLILSKKLNNKLKNSDYSVKRDKLLSYNEPYVKKFAEENELFKEENILRRTEKINNRIYEIYRFDKEKIKEMNSKISDPKYLSFIQKNKTAEKIYFKGGIESLISFFDSQKSK